MRSLRRNLLVLGMLAGIGRPAFAQEQPSTTDRPSSAKEAASTSSLKDSSFHLQSTYVTQRHLSFTSPYSGANSLSAADDTQTSETLTIYAGRRLWRGGEVFINPELAGGSGFNKTTGIAGFPNGEIYRVDDPSAKWNLARLFFKQTFGFGGEQEEFTDDKNQLGEKLDIKRFTMVLGRFSLNDYFDSNAYSHDPRTQFLNWALMDNPAWDYAADTRGYTWGLYFELNQPSWAVRLASVMVPKMANQLEMERNFPQFRGDEVEFEYRYKISDHPGAFRALAFRNSTNGGNYRMAIDTAAATHSQPDVTAVRSPSTKTGLGLNFEQALTNDFGAFARVGWNDGRNETWAFTEVDRSLSFGGSLKGKSWRRENDVTGLAFIFNGLSPEHRDYIANGGLGFVIGDSKLNYDLEEIAEIYYLYRVIDRLDVTGDYQFVRNPAYNSDRGPVSIFALRLHYEL